MYIKRHISKALLSFSKEYPAVLVTGPRQVGKSTVLQNTFADIEYQSLDNPKFRSRIAKDAEGYFNFLGYPLIVDEIQKAPELFEILKYFIDKENKNGMFYLSGSQKYNLMQGVSESLAGRICIVEMLGLSMREINNETFQEPFLPTNNYFNKRKSAIKKQNQNTVKKNSSLKNLWENIFLGSMPRLYKEKLSNPKKYFSNYVSTYIQRDVRQLSNIGDTIAFTDFLCALAARTGQILNIANISEDIGVSQPTLKKWLSILEATNIIYLLRPYHQNINKRIIKAPKVYFTDTGLVSYLCGWPDATTLAKGAQSGAIFETFVIDEILKSYYNAGIEPQVFYFRNSDKQEIDLLIQNNQTFHPIEIKKFSEPESRDIKNFKTLKTFFPKMNIGTGGIVCTSSQLLPLDSDNLIIPIQYI